MEDDTAGSQSRWPEIFRFYQAAIVNTAFGYGLYALLITVSVPIFAAQAISFVSGVCFNYFMYSRHVFRDGERSKIRFILAYGVNYLVNLGLLALLHPFIANEYLVGAIVTFIASLINYFALKHAVFVRKAAS